MLWWWGVVCVGVSCWERGARARRPGRRRDKKKTESGHSLAGELAVEVVGQVVAVEEAARQEERAVGA